MNVIGLGKAGCNIAKNFNQYPEYNVYQIDVGKEGPQCYENKKAQKSTRRPRRLLRSSSPTFRERHFL